MPKGTTQTRLENIKKLGADVNILDLNYDDCVRQAAKEAAATPHGVMVQDTAWDGYEEIPSWIMQGYGTMAMEAGEQLKAGASNGRRTSSSRPVSVPWPVRRRLLRQPL